MSRVVVRRPARIPPPPLPEGEESIDLPAVPARDPAGAAAWGQYLLPLAGSLGSLLFVATNPQPLTVASGLLLASSSVAAGLGLGVIQRQAQRRQARAERDRCLDHLARVRERAREVARRQEAAARWRHPDPEVLWTLARLETRVWERRPGDDDFLQLRAGLGLRPLAIRLLLKGPGPNTETEPVATAAARRLVAAHRRLPGQPVVLDLRRARIATVVGPPDRARALVRALLCQAVTFHAPDELRLGLALAADRAQLWDWCKWLPHLRPGAPGDVDPPPSLVHDPAGLAAMVGAEVEALRRARESEGTGARGGASTPARPWLLIVAEGVVPGREVVEPLGRPGAEGVTLLMLVEAREHEPARVDARLWVGGDGSLRLEPDPDGGGPARADRVGPRTCEALARILAPLRPAPEPRRRAPAEGLDLLPLLGIDDPGAGETPWPPRPPHGLLRVPIGVEAGGDPLFLDLKEAALGGDGPHGIVVGATGSGKSELLRTLVTGLALTHPPELLAFVLVDFKGGAAFADLAQLPHVAGLITNLADDLAMVDRMREALFGEQRRRQELLRKAGNLASLREYHRRRESGADLEPLPYLLIIVDEFAELLTARPDFIDLFVALGRLGRSLGMHLLLASQQLEEGRLRGLEGHISYRIALRTFSPADSRAAIDTVDAYRLPRLPGSGYLKAGTTTYQRFRAAHVSRPPEPARAGPARGLRPHTLEAAGGVAEAEGPARGRGDEVPGDGRPTVLETVVRRLRDATPAVHQVWLPPLEPRVGLGQLLGPTAEVAGRGLTATGWPGTGRLTVPIGLLDRPAEQRRDLLTLDLSGPAGHVAVIGAPQTGKSTLVRTLVLALALTHTPAEVQVYGIDLGGGTLAALEGLPHVGGIGDRREPERIRRTVRQLAALLEEREALFRRLGIDSAVAMRNARATGAVPEGLADVVLCVDGWASFRQEFEELEDMVRTIALRGLGYGVHLVLTAGHWMDVRPALLEAIGTRLELRLNDPGESAVDRRAAENVPVGVPGRGLTGEGLHFQVALPRLDGSLETADLQTALEGLVARAAGAWPGPAAPPVRVLPERVLFTDLPGPGADRGRGVPIGVSEHDLGPAYLDLGGGDPHCLVFGDGETGKTTLLRTFLLGLVARHPPSRARVLLLDYRRTLLGTIPPSHLAGYAGNAAAAADQIRELVELLTARLPPADLTVEELRQRSWWSGPEAYVVVDDYELVSAGAENPLLPLVEYLAQARDVGLHVILARRTGGASRALFEPLLMGLKDLNSQGLLLGGDPQEGPLLGDHRPEPLPAGRALQVVRNQARLVQVAWSPV
jgi:S-DNA-T family DNA segregation ATPase FtsK/SpoIIIE